MDPEQGIAVRSCVCDYRRLTVSRYFHIRRLHDGRVLCFLDQEVYPLVRGGVLRDQVFSVTSLSAHGLLGESSYRISIYLAELNATIVLLSWTRRQPLTLTHFA